MTGLTPGNTYDLSFAIASEGSGTGTGSTGAVVNVSFSSGSSTAAQDFTSTGSVYWSNWTTDTMTFVATSSSATLVFTDLAVEFPGWNDLGLDNVSVTGAGTSVTPLPAALPLFATGLGTMGLFGWRRKRKAPAAIAA